MTGRRPFIWPSIRPGCASFRSNVLVNIVATTAFGAKFVQLIPPEHPSPEPLRAGQVLDSGQVTVEINTVFQQLSSVLSKIDPAKLNETLGAIAKAFSGRGEQFGQTLQRPERLSRQDRAESAESEPRHRGHGRRVHRVRRRGPRPDQNRCQHDAGSAKPSSTNSNNLDAFLISTIGLADLGNDVVGTNRQALTDVMHLLVPTTDLTNEYHTALTCGLRGMFPLAKQPPTTVPGLEVLAGLSLGSERYRYPTELAQSGRQGRSAV